MIIQAAKNTALYLKSEDPLYVLTHSVPIDASYYLENQLSKPLLRIFSPILGDRAESELLKGKHTLVKKVMHSAVGVMSTYFKKSARCVGCNCAVDDESRPICRACAPRASILLQREVTDLSLLEEQFHRLWTECQNCQGDLHEEVVCSNRDCPIYYQRLKVRRDVQRQAAVVNKFDELPDDYVCSG